LAKLYLKENRVDEALLHLEKARSLDPKEKSAYSQLAVAYRRKGEPELATAMLKTLNQLNEEERTQNKRERIRLVKQGPTGETNQ
jgi:Flp pilus assembly protein TadD